MQIVAYDQYMKWLLRKQQQRAELDKMKDDLDAALLARRDDSTGSNLALSKKGIEIHSKMRIMVNEGLHPDNRPDVNDLAHILMDEVFKIQ